MLAQGKKLFKNNAETNYIHVTIRKCSYILQYNMIDTQCRFYKTFTGNYLESDFCFFDFINGKQ